MTGQYADPRSGKITLAAYAAAWQSTQVGRKATARIVDNALRVHILPVLGPRSLSSLTRSDMQGLVKALSGSLAPGSVRNVVEVVNGFWPPLSMTG